MIRYFNEEQKMFFEYMADQFENDKFSVLVISSRGNIEYCNQQFLQMSK